MQYCIKGTLQETLQLLAVCETASTTSCDKSAYEEEGGKERVNQENLPPV